MNWWFLLLPFTRTYNTHTRRKKVCLCRLPLLPLRPGFPFVVLRWLCPVVPLCLLPRTYTRTFTLPRHLLPSGPCSAGFSIGRTVRQHFFLTIWLDSVSVPTFASRCGRCCCGLLTSSDWRVAPRAPLAVLLFFLTIYSYGSFFAVLVLTWTNRGILYKPVDSSYVCLDHTMITVGQTWFVGLSLIYIYYILYDVTFAFCLYMPPTCLVMLTLVSRSSVLV